MMKKMSAGQNSEKVGRRLLAALAVSAAFWASPFAHAGYNPQRIGFSNRYPTIYADWKDAFLAGNGRMGITAG